MTQRQSLAAAASASGSPIFLVGKFWVEIEGIAEGFFTECTGFNVETEVESVREGGVNGFVHQLPTGTRWTNIVLKRGWVASDELWKWYSKIVAGEMVTKPVSIILYSNRGESLAQPEFQWDLEGAFPVKWHGPEFRADSAAVAVESLELAHRGWRPNPAGAAGRRS